MSTVERVARRAGVRLHFVGRQALVEAGDASPFLQACAQAELQVLGVEGFDFDGSSLRPDMRTILDLSALDDPRESIVEAERFVGDAARPGLLLDFTLAERLVG